MTQNRDCPSTFRCVEDGLLRCAEPLGHHPDDHKDGGELPHVWTDEDAAASAQIDLLMDLQGISYEH